MVIALIIFIALSICLGIICAFLFKICKEQKKELSTELDKYKGLLEEFHKYVEASKIKEQNKEEADEKIDNLHNGNAVSNAINILQK